LKGLELGTLSTGLPPLEQSIRTERDAGGSLIRTQ